MWGHASPEGGVMLGFVVWFCFVIAVCSAVAAGCVCSVYMLHMFAVCVGQTHK